MTKYGVTRIVCFLCLLFVVGCARYPLGMSEAEWQQLTPQQQLEARQQQSLLDEKRAARNEAARLERERIAAEERRIQYEKDVANGMIRQFSPFCMGGSKCPGDDPQVKIFNLGGFVYVDKVVFRAKDNIGKKHNAVIAIYADNQLVVGNLDIKRRGSDHELFVGTMARNIIFKIVDDDEVKVEGLKVYGQYLDADGARILITPSSGPGNVNR